MNKHAWLCSLMITLFVFSAPNLFAAKALEKAPGVRYFNVAYDYEKTDTITGEKTQVAWLEYKDRLNYKIELDTGIKNVRIIKLRDKGNFSTVTERLLNIRERLEYAVDRLSRDTNPRILIELSPVNRPSDSPSKSVDILIYCDPRFDGLNTTSSYYPIRIMTITDCDALQFAFLDQPDKFTERSPEVLASYIAAQIEAQFVTFIKIAKKYETYEKLAIDNAISGKIYRELFLRANDVINLTKKELAPAIIQDSLARIPLYQRSRLQTMSQIVPRDWNKDYRGIYFLDN